MDIRRQTLDSLEPGDKILIEYSGYGNDRLEVKELDRRTKTYLVDNTNVHYSIRTGVATNTVSGGGSLCMKIVGKVLQ